MRGALLGLLLISVLAAACGRAEFPTTEWVTVISVRDDDSSWGCTFRYADGREGSFASDIFDRDFRSVVPISTVEIRVGSRFRLNPDGCVMEVAP
ncbi:MAG: hypothetical protein QNJ90_16695 [Planctomycetota bacterium]|nr:hypothetical protein [Planctomycetota bacterium]